MSISQLFGQQGSRLFWARLPDDNVLDAESGPTLDAGEAYLVVRLTEMYLGRGRTLWRKAYPLAHGWIKAGEVEEHGVAGPSQLQLFDAGNLERVLVVNARLAGPLPYAGEELDLAVGLWSVPGDDVAQALLTTVGSLSAFAGPAAGAVAQLTALVKSSVENILRLNSTTLRLGVRDTFYAGNPLRAGFHVGIGADADTVDPRRLWLRGGHLMTGHDPMSADPYRAHDYLVVQVERLDIRADWPALPEIAAYNNEFAAVLADDSDVAAKRARLAALWPAFANTLHTSRNLTPRHAAKIGSDVAADLRLRLKELAEGNPFETKSPLEAPLPSVDPHRFELAEVPDYVTVERASMPLRPFD